MMDASTPTFLTPLRTEKIGPQRWILIDDLVYRCEFLSGLFIAPSGFQTDLASIPRVLWTIAPKVDRYDLAAVIHDAAYAGALQTKNGERVNLIKPLADKVFREALGACSVGGFRARLMYQMVHRFGSPAKHPLAENAVVVRPFVERVV